MREALLCAFLLACSSTTESRTIMLGADGGAEDSGGAAGSEGGINAEGGMQSEGAPADTHPGGSSGDATPASPCLEACRAECQAQTGRADLLPCLPVENPAYCGCILEGHVGECGWLPEPRMLSEICTDAG